MKNFSKVPTALSGVFLFFCFVLYICVLFSCLICAQVPENPKGEGKKKPKKAKGAVKKSEKATFKRSRGKCAVKAASNSSLKYGDYDLGKLPHDARPDLSKTNAGKHSFTLSFNGTVEVLLGKEAYFVKKIGAGGTGPIGQISWAKHGGPVSSFNVAKERAGLQRPSA